MSTDPDFVAWALAPARTLEEAFCIEILIEHALPLWQRAHQVKEPPMDWEKKRERQRRRQLNPAHRVVFSEVDVRRAAEMLPTMRELDHWTRGEDRELRDLSGLRFCPALRKLQVGPAELDNLDFLRFVPALESIWLQDEILEDYSGLAQCPGLKDVHLWVGFAWADLGALAMLPEMVELTMHANLPALRGVGPLRRLKTAKLWGLANGRAPLPDATWLPEMPALREATIEPLSRLTGIGRFTAIEELTVSGPFRDLTPLAESPARRLKVYGERFRDLAPLTRMPRLQVLEFGREYPLDYTPLLEAPLLREVRNTDEAVDKLELAALNAALGGWAGDYQLDPPRPLGPAVFRIVDMKKPEQPGFEPPSAPCPPEMSKPIRVAEGRWVAAQLERALTQWFGGPDWGETNCRDDSALRGEADVAVRSIEAAERLDEVVEVCRRTLAGLRHRWIADLTVDPRAEWQRDPEEWKDDVQQEMEDRIERARNFAERRRDYLDYLERLRQFQLRSEQGQTPPPEQFAPPEAEKDETDSDTLDTGASWEQDEHPRWREFYLRGDIVEEGFWIWPGFTRVAQRILTRAFEKPDSFDPKHDED